MFAPDYSATVAATKMWTNSKWAFYVLLDFYGINSQNFFQLKLCSGHLNYR